MKCNNKTLLWPVWGVAFLIGLLCTVGFAQDVKADDESALQAKAKPLADMIRECKVDIHLTEPTKITEYIGLIQKQTPTPLNIIVSRSARTAVVPPMQFHQVSVQAALRAAVTGTEDELFLNFEDKELISISRAVDSREIIEVINAFNVLGGVEEASLLSAIEIGLGMRDSSKEQVTLKFHKETKLLFVKGSEADVNIVLQIVGQLDGQP